MRNSSLPGQNHHFLESHPSSKKWTIRRWSFWLHWTKKDSSLGDKDNYMVYKYTGNGVLLYCSKVIVSTHPFLWSVYFSSKFEPARLPKTPTNWTYFACFLTYSEIGQIFFGNVTVITLESAVIREEDA